MDTNLRVRYHETMKWVTVLPGVDETILAAREVVISKVCEAALSSRLATEKRGEATNASFDLESIIRNKGVWTSADIAAAKAKTDAPVDRPPPYKNRRRPT